jgi:hypothetical protein
MLAPQRFERRLDLGAVTGYPPWIERLTVRELGRRGCTFEVEEGRLVLMSIAEWISVPQDGTLLTVSTAGC